MTKKLEELFDIASSDENELNEPIPGVAKETKKFFTIFAKTSLGFFTKIITPPESIITAPPSAAIHREDLGTFLTPFPKKFDLVKAIPPLIRDSREHA